MNPNSQVYEYTALCLGKDDRFYSIKVIDYSKLQAVERVQREQNPYMIVAISEGDDRVKETRPRTRYLGVFQAVTKSDFVIHNVDWRP